MNDHGNPTLLLLQFGCFSITLVLTLVLLISRIHQRPESRSYEASRWMLIAALSLYTVHYLLQMLFGFRAQGEDVGALINILFYLPSAFLLASATLRLATGQRYMKRFVIIGTSGILLSLLLFLIGLVQYGSLHMPWILRIMGVLYVIMILFFIFHPGGELRRMNRKIEDETADDISDYRLYMHSGSVMLYTMGLIGALSIFHTSSVFAVAAFFLLALIFYVVSFVALGFNISPLSSIIDEREATADQEVPAAPVSEAKNVEEPPVEAPTTSRLTVEQTTRIEAAIADWRAEHGYSAQNLTSITMAQRLGISKRQLTQYLAETVGVTFRVWLSDIRIDEAKRMLLAEPAYSIEAIAEMCGFSSRSWMQEKFKSSTGMTPNDWREAQKA